MANYLEDIVDALVTTLNRQEVLVDARSRSLGVERRCNQVYTAKQQDADAELAGLEFSAMCRCTHTQNGARQNVCITLGRLGVVRSSESEVDLRCWLPEFLPSHSLLLLGIFRSVDLRWARASPSLRGSGAW